MLAAFGVDVLDPRTTLRRVWVLLHRLPPTGRQLDSVWTPEAHLLAAVLDQLGYLTYVTLKAAGVKSAKPPKPVARPGVHSGQSSSSSARPKMAWASLARALTGRPGVMNDD